jgi:hypothetical protein
MRPSLAATTIFLTLTLAVSCCSQIIPFQEGVVRDANDDVSMTMDELIRSEEGSPVAVEERSRSRRRLTGIMYKERTSGNCGDSGGGWGKIASAAACGAGAVAVGWSDTTAGVASGGYPPGCYFHSEHNMQLYFNTDNSNVACSSARKCLCTIVCLSGTYQDETGQSSCKSCPSDTYSMAGASSCTFEATSCPTGTYATGTAACDLCGTGQYSLAGSSSCLYNTSYCANALGVTCDANTLKEMWPFVAPLEKKITTLESSVTETANQDRIDVSNQVHLILC